jgi:ATP-dependent RNA helicase HelY
VKRKKNLHDRLGPERRGSLNERMEDILLASAAVREVEDRHKVSHAKEPDGAFMVVLAAWARGVSLGTVLDIADVEVGTISPGDFVRTAKQVADLCEQFSRLSNRPELAAAANAARDLVLRSVVAGASTIHQ